jgi:hypothetical protein
MPPFLKSLTGAKDDGTLTDLVIDDVRNVLYAVSSNSVLSVFYLGINFIIYNANNYLCVEKGPLGNDSTLVTASFNILDETKAFLFNNRSRIPDSSPKSEVFSNDSSSAGFNIVGIFVIPLIESKKSHLIVVLGNGIRIYLSLITSFGSQFLFPLWVL